MCCNYVPSSEETGNLYKWLSKLSPAERASFFTTDEYLFGKYIFPALDPEPFRILYADLKRPCYPVNILLAFELLRLIYGFSDEIMLSMLQWNTPMKCALHLYDYKDGKQLPSLRTLERFRARVDLYYEKTGIDLMQNAFMKMAEKGAEQIHTDISISRIDTGFVDSHVEKLSRLKLLYRCTALAVEAVKALDLPLEEAELHYLESYDWNQISYYDQETPSETKVQRVIQDMAHLLERYQDHPQLGENLSWQLMVRAFQEQVFHEADGSLRLKKGRDEGLGSSTLQTPADPDATFRKKAGEEHTGYQGLIVDFGKGETTMRLYWDYALNNVSDPILLEKYLRSLPEISTDEEPRILVGDGMFSSLELVRLAAARNVSILTTNLVGKKPDFFVLDHVYSEDGRTLLECANGIKPLDSTWNEKNEQIFAHFDRKACESCPLKEKCSAKIQKKNSALRISSTAVERARSWQDHRESDSFGKWSRYRNGIECNFALLRNKYQIDRLPVVTYVSTRYLFNCIMGAINAKQVCKHFRRITKEEVKKYQKELQPST